MAVPPGRTMRPEAERLADRFLEVIETDILPLTEAGVAAGNKVFGAAILKKSDYSLVVAASNQERTNPLFHGEVAALNAFYRLPDATRPATADCLFLATHEPCSLCLSAITWAGFDNFTYLFPYEVTRDAFAIPHDLAILKEVFGIKDGAYRGTNAFWTATALVELIDASSDDAQVAFAERVARIKDAYQRLSSAYQAEKLGSGIALS